MLLKWKRNGVYCQWAKFAVDSVLPETLSELVLHQVPESPNGLMHEHEQTNISLFNFGKLKRIIVKTDLRLKA